jgi:hypothetical protein
VKKKRRKRKEKRRKRKTEIFPMKWITLKITYK